MDEEIAEEAQEDIDDTELIAWLREETKDLLTPVYDTDFNLLRWIIGHNRDKNKILTGLRRYLKIRKVFGLDTIRETLPTDIFNREYIPIGVLGPTGIDNKFVVVEFGGRADPYGLMRTSQTYQFLLQRFKRMEGILELFKAEEVKAGEMSGVIYILDLEGLQMDPSLLSIVTKQYRILWDHLANAYPEWVSKFFVINCPTFISILWSALSPLLPEHTKQKIVITGEDWRQQLREHISEDRMPSRWGGKLSEKDGLGKINVPTGKVPESLYWKPGFGLPDPKELTPVSVEAGALELISNYVLDTNVNMKWTIYGHEEYTLGVYFSEDPKTFELSEMEEIFPDAEYPGLESVDSMQVLCERAGMYHLKFGNEKAWWYPVEIRYKLEFTDQEGNPVSTVPVESD